jgi:hypothetical protein
MSNKELLERLAKEHGADYIESGVRIDQQFKGQRTIKPHYLFSDDELEAMCKAYQAAAPIDKVAEALEKAADIANSQPDNGEQWNDACVKIRNEILALIPDTQAKKVDLPEVRLGQPHTQAHIDALIPTQANKEGE